GESHAGQPEIRGRELARNAHVAMLECDDVAHVLRAAIVLVRLHRLFPSRECVVRYFTISSSSTSKTSVAPGLMRGGAPRSPYARSAGHTSRLLPPTFIICTPSVQQRITPLSGNVTGSPRWYELSKTVPSVSVPW